VTWLIAGTPEFLRVVHQERLAEAERQRVIRQFRQSGGDRRSLCALARRLVKRSPSTASELRPSTRQAFLRFNRPGSTVGTAVADSSNKSQDPRREACSPSSGTGQ
jgi:hypothetical protein